MIFSTVCPLEAVSPLRACAHMFKWLFLAFDRAAEMTTRFDTQQEVHYILGFGLLCADKKKRKLGLLSFNVYPNTKCYFLLLNIIPGKEFSVVVSIQAVVWRIRFQINRLL